VGQALVIDYLRLLRRYPPFFLRNNEAAGASSQWPRVYTWGSAW